MQLQLIHSIKSMMIGHVRRTGRDAEGDNRLLIGTDALSTRVE